MGYEKKKSICFFVFVHFFLCSPGVFSFQCTSYVATNVMNDVSCNSSSLYFSCYDPIRDYSASCVTGRPGSLYNCDGQVCPFSDWGRYDLNQDYAIATYSCGGDRCQMPCPSGYVMFDQGIEGGCICRKSCAVISGNHYIDFSASVSNIPQCGCRRIGQFQVGDDFEYKGRVSSGRLYMGAGGVENKNYPDCVGCNCTNWCGPTLTWCCGTWY